MTNVLYNWNGNTRMNNFMYEKIVKNACTFHFHGWKYEISTHENYIFMGENDMKTCP